MNPASAYAGQLETAPLAVYKRFAALRGSGTEENPCLIGSEEEWNTFLWQHVDKDATAGK